MSEIADSMLFRQRLYQSFKQSGLLSKLKTSLRADLMQRLEKPTSNLPHEQDESSTPFHLRRKFLQSVVAEYLRSQHLSYSHSIFMAECDLEEEDCLRGGELSQIVNLGKPAGTSFLSSLLDEFSRIRCQEARERSTQTDFDQSLSKKLELAEKGYRAKIDYWKLLPGSLADKKEQTLQKLEEELRCKFAREKEEARREMERAIKQQMEKKYENQYLFRMREVQKQHEGRLKELSSREKAVIEGLERKKGDLEEKAKMPSFIMSQRSVEKYKCCFNFGTILMVLSQKEQSLINRYEKQLLELEHSFELKLRQLEAREKEFWKRELEVAAKKREYEDTIRLVRQKAVAESVM